MKKAFGAILIAVILIVCVVTLTVQRGENAMLEFPERPAEGCTVMSLEITDGKAQTEVIGTYNVNENVLTINTSALENVEPAESGENSLIPLRLLFPPNPLRWASAGALLSSDNRLICLKYAEGVRPIWRGKVFSRAVSNHTCTNAATFVSRGCGGYTRHPIS